MLSRTEKKRVALLMLISDYNYWIELKKSKPIEQPKLWCDFIRARIHQSWTSSVTRSSTQSPCSYFQCHTAQARYSYVGKAKNSKTHRERSLNRHCSIRKNLTYLIKGDTPKYSTYLINYDNFIWSRVSSVVAQATGCPSVFFWFLTFLTRSKKIGYCILKPFKRSC
jgi:hypothetical protein